MLQFVKNMVTHRFLTRYGWFYLALVLTALVSFWGGLRYARSTQSTNQSLATLLDTNLPEWMNRVERHSQRKSLGNPDAPVTIVEYMDIECPYCKRYSERIFPKIINQYVRTGKVHYVIKHFPLPERIHPHAMLGAIASECAARQGKFWKYKALAMNNRRFQSRSTFLALAELANLPDQEKFSNCLENRVVADRVKRDVRRGQRRGVSGTPTIFIDGTEIDGLQSFSRYESAIESALKSTREAS